MSMIRNFVRKYPKLKGTLKPVLFKLSLMQSRVQTNKIGVEPDKTYWVSPECIKNAVFVGTNVLKDSGKVIGGDWDLKSLPFEDSKIFKAFEARFISGKQWKETDFYKEQIEKILSGVPRWECLTQKEFDTRLRKVDKLFADIKKDGYKSQTKIRNESGVYNTGQHEVTVAVGRAGELLFAEGRHRLCIAKILNLKSIAVKITVRHKKWVSFRNEILAWAEKTKGGMYQPLLHLDLASIPSVHDDARFNMIMDVLPFREGKLLDIGANWGYHCHKFEEAGFDCVAVEADSNNFYFLDKLRAAQHRSFKAVNKSIFDYKDENKFQVVIALNILYHFLKTKELYDKMVSFLNNLEVKVIIFQTHHHERLKGAYRNFNEEDFVNFVLKHTRLGTAKVVGTPGDGRKLYMLTK